MAMPPPRPSAPLDAGFPVAADRGVVADRAAVDAGRHSADEVVEEDAAADSQTALAIDAIAGAADGLVASSAWCC